jgi:LysM repeat protein
MNFSLRPAARRAALICSFLLLLSFPLFADTVYTVAKGETLYSIARRFGVSQDILLSANNIRDASKIFAGQKLTIPGNDASLRSPTPEAATFTYTAERGDSLYGIARKFNVTVDNIRKANKLSDTYMLKIGDSLKIPSPVLITTVAPESPEPKALPVAAAKPASGLQSSAPETPVQAAPVADGDTTGSKSPGLWPVAAQKVEYTRGKVLGVMLSTDEGEAVKSVSAGQVLASWPYRGYGNVAIVETEGGYVYVYGNCGSLSVKPGDKVAAGSVIGTAQNANDGGGEVFFSVYRNSKAIDPAKAPRI